MTVRNDRAAGHLLALVTITIWGTTFVATKTLLRDYDALQIMLMRFFLAWVVLLLLTRRIGKPAGLKEEAGIFALSLSGVSLYYFFENTALTYTLASNVSILLAAAPIFTAVLAHFFTKKNTLRLVKPQNLLHKLKQITATGFSTFFIDVAMGILTILFNRQIMACLGTNALSVYGVIVNISTFVQYCAYSVGQASQPIISTNFGAGKGDRIRETLFLCKTQRISKHPRTSTRSKNVLLRV